jgi:hypothetical protein
MNTESSLKRGQRIEPAEAANAQFERVEDGFD